MKLVNQLYTLARDAAQQAQQAERHSELLALLSERAYALEDAVDEEVQKGVKTGMAVEEAEKALAGNEALVATIADRAGVCEAEMKRMHETLGAMLEESKKMVAGQAEQIRIAEKSLDLQRAGLKDRSGYYM